MTIKITILGCGGSSGVPLIGGEDGRGDWGVCDSINPKNRRTRASVVVEKDSKRLLIDTGPDMREQLLANGIKIIDAVLFTHAHADHIHGVDDIRGINNNAKRIVTGYADEQTIAHLRRMFPYIFADHPPGHFYKPAMYLEAIKEYEEFIVEGIKAIPFRQIHGSVDSLGFRFGNVAYSTDVKSIPEESDAYLENLDLWIVDCLQRQPHGTHAHLDLTLSWIEKYKPKRAILTHLSQDLDYETLKKELPPHIEPAYDGMIITV